MKWRKSLREWSRLRSMPKPFNPNTWQGQVIDSLDQLLAAQQATTLAVQTAGGGVTAVPEVLTSYRDGQCSLCVNWLDDGSGTSGDCRRVPPTEATYGATGGSTSHFPVTADTDSCSEWRAIPTP